MLVSKYLFFIKVNIYLVLIGQVFVVVESHDLGFFLKISHMILLVPKTLKQDNL